MSLKILLLLNLFLIPLLGSTGDFGYEQIKVVFFIVSITLIGFVWVFGKHKLKWNPIKIASSIFILTLFLTSILGINSRVSFLGNDPYFQGWVVYAYLFLFSFLISVSKLKLKLIALTLSFGSLFVALVAIKDWVLLTFFNSPVPTYAGRVVSSFGQPNFYAGFLLLTLPFSYYLFKGSTGISQGHSLSTQGVTLYKLSFFGFFSGLISVAGIFVSYSRSAILLSLILLILGLIDQLKIKFRLGLAVFMVIGVSILIALKLSSGIMGNEVVKPVLTTNPDLTKEPVEKRVYIWPVALQITLQKPLTGYGLENISQAFSVYFQENKHPLFEENLQISPVLISLKDLNIDRSHNYLLDLLLFSGLLGLLGWLGLLGVLFKKLGQTYHARGKFVLIVSLVTYLVWIQFQNQSIVHLIYFWLLVGLTDLDVDKAADK